MPPSSTSVSHMSLVELEADLERITSFATIDGVWNTPVLRSLHISRPRRETEQLVIRYVAIGVVSLRRPPCSIRLVGVDAIQGCCPALALLQNVCRRRDGTKSIIGIVVGWRSSGTATCGVYPSVPQYTRHLPNSVSFLYLAKAGKSRMQRQAHRRVEK